MHYKEAEDRINQAITKISMLSHQINQEGWVLMKIYDIEENCRLVAAITVEAAPGKILNGRAERKTIEAMGLDPTRHAAVQLWNA